MVHLILSSTKGNQGVRYFPYSGYLGLTPVKVEGLRTKLDDDAKQLLASSITISVRCYESRLGRVSTLHSNILVDYTQVLWSKPDGVDYAPIDELEFPFRVTVPTKVAGFSTAVFVDYRCTWRVEAVINHIPISGVGSRQLKHFDLPLIRFDLPPHQPTLPPPSTPPLHYQTTKPKAPRIRYSIHPPTSPIGPLDIISIPIFLLPLDDDCTVRSATVMIERRIQLNESISHSASEISISPYPIPSPRQSSSRASLSSSLSSHSYSPTSSYQERTPAKFNGVATVSSDVSSNPTITPRSIYASSDTRLLLSPTHSIPPPTPSSSSASHTPSKLITTPVVGAETSGQFLRDDRGVWTKSITLQWPAVKPHSRWANGETIQSELVSVRFFARVKVTVSSPNGTESIELAEKELLIVSTNEAERQLAISKYTEMVNLFQSSTDKPIRSKSKSPRRIRRDHELDAPPSPAPFLNGGKYSNNNSTGSVTGSTNQSSGTGGKVAPLRRPHTSAGPRDKKAFDFLGNTRTEGRDRMADPWEGQKRVNLGSSSTPRPETSQGASKRRSGMVGSLFWSAPKIATAFSGSSNGTNTSVSGSSSLSRSTSSSVTSSVDSMNVDTSRDAKMREWEEELARIEMRSRRSSDMLGFAGKRKRSGAPTVAEVPGA